MHDNPLATCTNNLVIFNEHYNENQFFSIANLGDWNNGHLVPWYVSAINTILDSQLYDLTTINSTIAVADATREKIWVQDLNCHALEHQGPTFIPGSEKNDFLANAEFGNTPDYHDYLAAAGNDTLFTLNNNSSIMLVGVNLNDLHEDQFAMA